jgi:glycosyltransferase involved in cell wall biosynthesis
MTPRRFLICAPSIPDFDRQAGSQRIFDFIQFLREGDWAVTLIAESQLVARRYVSVLQQAGVAVYVADQQPIDHLLEASRFDVAMIAFWHTAERFLPLIRKYSPETRIIVDSIDLHFMRNARRLFWASKSSQATGMLGASFAGEMARELNVYAAADAVLGVSQKETDLVGDLVSDHSLSFCVPLNGELALSKEPFARRHGILFLGNFWHAPNIDALEYFCTGILPLVAPGLIAQHPIYVVGNGLDHAIAKMDHVPAGVRVVGWVPSVFPYLERSRISVVPLRYGAGTKGKLLQALMAGTPTVSTTIGVEGLTLRDGEDVLVADDPATFALFIEKLLQDHELWERLARQGREQIWPVHCRQAVRTRFMEVLEQIQARPVRASAQARPEMGKPCAEPNRYGTELIGAPLSMENGFSRMAGKESPQTRIEPADLEVLRPIISLEPPWVPAGAAPRVKILVLGVYLAGQRNNIDDIVSILGQTTGYEVCQEWIGLGGAPPTLRVADVTVESVPDKTAKFPLLNRLLKERPLDSYEYVMIIDDDIVLPRKFLDAFITFQQYLGFAIAQPARTNCSFIDHPIVQQQPGVLARQTLYVEIGPVVSVHRSTYDMILPFDETNPMGWGFENVWSYRLQARGARMGIIDVVPVDHSLRKPAAHYEWEKANRDRAEYFAKNEHLPYSQCFRTVELVPL